MKEKIGVFVSNSVFSQVACDELIKMGYDIVVFSFGEKTGYDGETVLDFGDISGFLNFAFKYGLKKLVFAGKIDASSIFNKKMAKSGEEFLMKMSDLKPENILENLADFFVKKGMEIIPLTKIFNKYLAKQVVYTHLEPDDKQWKDIHTGWKIAKMIANLGIGQAIAIKNGMVISVEGIEGTDAMIKRTGSFCKDFIVVKVIKDSQDTRFDLPTIGPDTIKNFIVAGGRVLAVEAGKTVLINLQEMIEIANDNHIVILGFKRKETGSDSKRKSRRDFKLS